MNALEVAAGFLTRTTCEIVDSSLGYLHLFISTLLYLLLNADLRRVLQFTGLQTCSTPGISYNR